MRKEQVSEACIASFRTQHASVEKGETGTIPESAIQPVEKIPSFDSLPKTANTALLTQTVFMKLNGGLGTGMGLDKPKALLTVKGDDTFLDFIAKQVTHIRKQYDSPVKFMLMNSFSTSDDTKKFFQEKYPDYAKEFQDIEVLQNKVPKILQENFFPAQFPADPSHEWVPPGHGDLYAALYGSGKLDQLLQAGYKYLFVSNCDNLGATLDLNILTFFAQENLDFLMEVCERQESDKKGGHLAQKPGGGLLLRESAQCPKADEAAFQDITRHRYFNTNNLWVNLESLKKVMDEHGGFIPLPVIRNAKTVNPTDANSAKVFQLETAMGTAISAFAHASALVVPRTRFAPVKTCSDLVALRSDCYSVTPDYRLVLDTARNGVPPVVVLEDKYYKFVDQFEKMIPHGAPSMIKCNRLTVKGPVEFDAGVVLEDAVTITNAKEERQKVSGHVKGDVSF
jgi:UTP--glucose-1-phosphate uridylyltransferase